MRRSYRISTLAVMAQFAVMAAAGPFTPGNIVISRIGDGSAALNSAATAVFLDEYTTAGVFVQTVAAPTTGSGNNRTLTNSGSATSEGFVARSDDKGGVVIVGYDAPVGTAGVATSDAAVINRVVGFVKADGTIDSSTNVSDGYSGGNIRSGCTVDGTAFWMGGTAASTGGVRYVVAGPGQTSTQLSTTVTNTRVVDIFGGQLLVSTGSGAFKGVNTVGVGLPTTSGQTIAILPGFDGSTASTASPYQYAFADANTLYVVDDRSMASGGGLQKWTFDGSVWTLQYTLTAGLTGTSGPRGLVVTPNANGNIVYVTSSESAANSLYTLVDTGALSTFIAVATAAANTRFRGLSWTPEAGGATTETLAPISEQILLGTQNSGGNLGSWAADDANARNICKFFVPSITSPFIRVLLNYTTTKTNPTAISFDVKVGTHTPGPQAITLAIQNKVTTLFDPTSVTLASSVNGTTYNGAVGGVLTNYVGGGGAMTGRIEILQTGPSTQAFPCSSFEFGQMAVTG